jgi:hypothetical protein
MDSLGERFSEIKNKATKIILDSKTKGFSSEFDEIVAATKQMLENQALIDDLNENIFWLYKKNDDKGEYECFYELLEALMTFIEAKHDQNENAFKIIEIISEMRLREILVIQSTFLLSLLHLMTPDKEERILKILLNLSENHVYERIDFSNLDHSTLLDRIKEIVTTIVCYWCWCICYWLISLIINQSKIT